MKYLRSKPDDACPADNPLFRGEVRTQVYVDVPGAGGQSDSDSVRLQLVRFAPGAYTRLHTHETDQVLVITDGEGFVGTADQHTLVRPGDIVHVRGGEPHYHGATSENGMSHLSILTPGRLEIVDDGWTWPHEA